MYEKSARISTVCHDSRPTCLINNKRLELHNAYQSGPGAKLPPMHVFQGYVGSSIPAFLHCFRHKDEKHAERRSLRRDRAPLPVIPEKTRPQVEAVRLSSMAVASSATRVPLT